MVHGKGVEFVNSQLPKAGKRSFSCAELPKQHPILTDWMIKMSDEIQCKEVIRFFKKKKNA